MMFYYFKFSNGHTHYYTHKEALEYANKNGVDIIRDGALNAHNTKTRIRDGFRSGYNVGLGCVVNDYGHYKRILKERGLEEGGKEHVMQQPDKNISYFDDKMIKEINDMGVTIDGNEAEALKKGEIAPNFEVESVTD